MTTAPPEPDAMPAMPAHRPRHRPRRWLRRWGPLAMVAVALLAASQVVWTWQTWNVRALLALLSGPTP